MAKKAIGIVLLSWTTFLVLLTYLLSLLIFHAIHPEKAIWKTILSQTNLLNIFPASVPLSTVKKVLEANCIRNSNKYIPVNSLWVTKLFIRLANDDSEKTCLKIDCSGFNHNGPGRFRTDASNPLTQTFFFNKADQDSLFNIFIGKRIKENSKDKILFEIEGLKTSADNETYSPALELENLQGNGLSNVRSNSDEQDGEQNGSGYDQNFCLNDNDIPKKKNPNLLIHLLK